MVLTRLRPRTSASRTVPPSEVTPLSAPVTVAGRCGAARGLETCGVPWGMAGTAGTGSETMVKHYENLWRNHGKLWKPMEKLWKTMKNHGETMKTMEKPWKTLKNNGFTIILLRWTVWNGDWNDLTYSVIMKWRVALRMLNQPFEKWAACWRVAGWSRFALISGCWWSKSSSNAANTRLGTERLHFFHWNGAWRAKNMERIGISTLVSMFSDDVSTWFVPRSKPKPHGDATKNI